MSPMNPKYDTFRTIDTNTVNGIEQAERLHQSEQWEQINVGFNTITYGRLKMEQTTTRPRTVSEAATEILTALGDERKTFDTAVPQSFADDFRAKTGMYTIGNIVWYYPKGSAFGMPLAVNPEAYGKLLMYYATK